LRIDQNDYQELINNFGALIGKKLTLKEPFAEGVFQNFKFILNLGGVVKSGFTIERFEIN
jgi:hypothetical protein